LCEQKSIINDVKHIMSQGGLPFKYEEERTKNGMTALAGLPVYLDLASWQQHTCSPCLGSPGIKGGFWDTFFLRYIVILNSDRKYPIVRITKAR
jgi:hypothetical protein